MQFTGKRRQKRHLRGTGCALDWNPHTLRAKLAADGERLRVEVDAVWAELERVRRDVATTGHYLEFANPDTVVTLRERLERAEAREQELLRQLSET